MATDKKVARRTLCMLLPSSELVNLSEACKIKGYSRKQFYDIRRNIQAYVADVLLNKGRVYLQIVIDYFSCHAWGRL